MKVGPTSLCKDIMYLISMHVWVAVWL